MAKSFASEGRIEKTAILELLRIARTMKRQLMILKSLNLDESERKLMKEVVKCMEDDFDEFNRITGTAPEDQPAPKETGEIQPGR